VTQRAPRSSLAEAEFRFTRSESCVPSIGPLGWIHSHSRASGETTNHSSSLTRLRGHIQSIRRVAEGSTDLDGHDLSGILLLEQWL
jgi:hypothetical protein